MGPAGEPASRRPASRGEGAESDGSLFKFVMTATPLSSYRDTLAAGAEERMGKQFVHLPDPGLLVSMKGLACLSTVTLQQSRSAFA